MKRHSTLTSILAILTVAIASPAAAQYYPVDLFDTGAGQAEQVEVGFYHMCVLTHCGGIECGGNNYFGEGAAPGDRDFIDVAAGALHSCGLHEDGTVECWGDDRYGQLAAPQDVVFTSIDGGWYHTCGVTDDQRVRCWGDDGDGDFDPPWWMTSERFLEVEAGQGFTCGLIEWGLHTAAACWAGSYSVNPVLDARTAYTPRPAYLVTAGYQHACYKDGSFGDLVCLGDDSHGQTSSHNGWQYEHAGVEYLEEAYYHTETYVTDVSAGTFHTCVIHDDTEEIECWGQNYYGQCSAPGGDFVQVAASNHTTCAIDTDGELHCWGYDYAGSLTMPDLSYACADNVAEMDYGYWWWL